MVSIYKNSSALWIEQLPEKWDVKKVKYIARFRYGDALPDEHRIDGNYAVYGSNGPVGSHETTNTLSPAIIIGRKGSFGKLHYLEEPGFAIDTTYFVDKRLTKNHLKWVYYALGILRLDELSKDSAVPGLSRDEAYSYFLSVPPYSEQVVIAEFLDKKTAEIDSLIAKKQALLKLLAEKRAALITQTVTKGLNVNVTMKKSGINWLGAIPEKWNLKRLKFCVLLISDKKSYDAFELPYMGLEHIESWTGKRLYDDTAISEGVVCKFKPTDVLFGKLRPYLAKVYLAKEEGCASTEVLVLRSGQQESMLWTHLTHGTC